jgi:Ca2+-binding RTX toxin-like protein
VLSAVSYTLPQYVEHLTLTGSLDSVGAGNELDNVITGNDADNSLWGLAGNDRLVGNGDVLPSNVTYGWHTQRIRHPRGLMKRAA